MIRVLFSMLFVLSGFFALAAKVDTVTTHSAGMNKDIRAVVISPDSYNRSGRFPVLYLLHGYSDNYSSWVRKCTDLQALADQFQVIVVCPDGGFSSWYYDSPIDKNFRYETYVANELVSWVDSNYRTIADRRGRAITGLSMGGHGALYLALKHQDTFIAAGSMSGGVDIRPFPDNWDIARRLGPYAVNPENWERNTVINMLNLVSPKNRPELIIDCGTEDFFYRCNAALHEKLSYLNIPHDFISRPGRHDWNYWNVAIKYQMLFLCSKMDRATR